MRRRALISLVLYVVWSRSRVDGTLLEIGPDGKVHTNDTRPSGSYRYFGYNRDIEWAFVNEYPKAEPMPTLDFRGCNIPTHVMPMEPIKIDGVLLKKYDEFGRTFANGMKTNEHDVNKLKAMTFALRDVLNDHKGGKITHWKLFKALMSLAADQVGFISVLVALSVLTFFLPLASIFIFTFRRFGRCGALTSPAGDDSKKAPLIFSIAIALIIITIFILALTACFQSISMLEDLIIDEIPMRLLQFLTDTFYVLIAISYEVACAKDRLVAGFTYNLMAVTHEHLANSFRTYHDTVFGVYDDSIFRAHELLKCVRNSSLPFEHISPAWAAILLNGQRREDVMSLVSTLQEMRQQETYSMTNFIFLVRNNAGEMYHTIQTIIRNSTTVTMDNSMNDRFKGLAAYLTNFTASVDNNTYRGAVEWYTTLLKLCSLLPTSIAVIFLALAIVAAIYALFFGAAPEKRGFVENGLGNVIRVGAYLVALSGFCVGVAAIIYMVGGFSLEVICRGGFGEHPELLDKVDQFFLTDFLHADPSYRVIKLRLLASGCRKNEGILYAMNLDSAFYVLQRLPASVTSKFYNERPKIPDDTRLRQILDDLEKRFSNCTNAATTIAHIRHLRSRLPTDADFGHALLRFQYSLQSSLNEFYYSIVYNFARCKAAYQIYANVGTMLCDRLGPPFHGTWLSAVIVLVFYFPTAAILFTISRWMLRIRPIAENEAPVNRDGAETTVVDATDLNNNPTTTAIQSEVELSTSQIRSARCSTAIEMRTPNKEQEETTRTNKGHGKDDAESEV